MGGTLFEELGFYYVGPVDGHNLKHLLPVLENVKEASEAPILVHVVTKKGYGYGPAERSKDKFHGVARFDFATGQQNKPKAKAKSFTSHFASQLIKEAQKDKNIIAITAAMPDGTGLSQFGAQFPDRFFDVGIAEQHAVTFGAGAACEGLKPYIAIYSTFLQRAYDQIVHDVAIQKLPVRFAIDRAGLVGADGPTHAGTFDLAYLGCLPHFIIMAPSDEVELSRMVKTSVMIEDAPSAFRYPRGASFGLPMPKEILPLEIGKARIICEGQNLAILNFGARLEEVKKAVALLGEKGFKLTIADMRFVKPLDTELLLRLVKHHHSFLTIEEASSGGAGAHVGHFLARKGLFDKGLGFRTLTLPDYFINHNQPHAMYEEAGLTFSGIVEALSQLLGLDVCKPHKPTQRRA